MVSGSNVLLQIRINIIECSINKTFIKNPELKKEVKSNVLKLKDDIILNFEEKCSCWTKVKGIIAMAPIWKINHEMKKKISHLKKNEVSY